jgi:Tfp pilus assembly protein FimV
VQELQETLAAKDRQLQKLQAGKPAPAATTGPSAALPRARGQWGWYAFAAAPYVVCTLWLAFLWH